MADLNSTISNSDLSKAFLTHSGAGNNQTAFTNERFALDKEILKKIVQEFNLDEVILFHALVAKKLTIEIQDFQKLKVFQGYVAPTTHSATTKHITTVFFPFIVQTTSQLHLLIISDFDIYDYANLDPFILDNILEDYQTGLFKCFGLKYAKMYEGTTTENINESTNKHPRIVAKMTRQFHQISIDKKSYLLCYL